MNKFNAKTARHEAAHFVIDWVMDCPSTYIDITGAAKKIGRDDSTEGITFGGTEPPTPFEKVLSSIAGPVADNWDHKGDEFLEIENDNINLAVSELSEGQSKDWDWNECINQLPFLGINICDPVLRRTTLLLCANAVRSTLKLCESQWNEITEHLIENGRIGYNGDLPDCGEGAEAFFFRWSDNWGIAPDYLKQYITELRASFCALAGELPPLTGKASEGHGDKHSFRGYLRLQWR